MVESTQQLLEDDTLSSPGSMPPPMSSPSRRPSSYGVNGQKERRQASITPRKFHRFFEPRTVHSINVGSTRRTLFDITPSANNRNGTRSSPIRRNGNMSGDENSPTPFRRAYKRRRVIPSVLSHEPIEADDESASSIFPPDVQSEVDDDPFASQTTLDSPPDSPSKFAQRMVPRSMPERRIERVEDRGISGKMLHLNISSNASTRRQHHIYPVAEYQDDTSHFYSLPADAHIFSVDRPELESAIPFCTAPCNTNTLVAFGDERGQVRLVESGREGKPAFEDSYLSFRPHSNAVIDLSFSQDDSLLASGCGDRKVKVTDMFTQRTIATFEAHESSVKQVRFQPGSANNSVLASSGREGNIFIYDLRCNSSDGPVHSIAGSADTTSQRGLRINNIIDAHRPGNQQRGPDFAKITNHNWATVSERAQWKESIMRPREYGPISVTSLAWLQPDRSHLLLSGSEINSSIKLWDIRSIPSRNELAVPLSTTTPPPSHVAHRSVGITSIALSTDGARIYTPAKDNAVYVYSTNHLISGHAPELSPNSKFHRPTFTTHHSGPSPLYAYRHPLLMIGTFYIKCAIRPAVHGRAELLAVGSTDQCALLFPTDERHLNGPVSDHSKYFPTAPTTTFASNKHSTSTTTAPTSTLDFNVRSTPRNRKIRAERAVRREGGALMISGRGTALVEGHGREVSAVGWNAGGELITVGDDYRARIWREGTSINRERAGGDGVGDTMQSARSLRLAGHGEGKRWGCGWADVVGGYDEDGDSDCEIED